MLIPHKATGWDTCGKRVATPLRDGSAAYQVVGGVMAYQA